MVDSLGMVAGRRVVVDQFRSSHARRIGRSCTAAQTRTRRRMCGW
jgi:hypothetical protein